MIRIPGAEITGDKCVFTVWAPEKETMTLHIVAPAEQYIAMQKDACGYFTAALPASYAGCHYYYNAGGKSDLPDPASRHQPGGVAGASQLIAQQFGWTDGAWRNAPLHDYIIYELHIGTFTPEGTFEAAIAQLDDLVALGINAIEIMPVAQFSGGRNWGYDGVFPYAPQNTYGGYLGLKKLVDACHARGIAVILDVVYNHIGPEGNVLPEFAPYFTTHYGTPWGRAINFDGAYSDGVREYFCGNALYWLEHFHIDALRLDAVHQMYDFGAVHFWEYLHEQVRQLSQRLGRHLYLVAESDLNNPRMVRHPQAGGYGFNAQWLDDFHHALYVLLYPEGRHRYADFGTMEQLAKAYTDGFVHSGEYVRFRRKKFGASSAGIPGDSFIAFIQNHDQVGNTVSGTRLSAQVSPALQQVAAAALLLSPYIPMLFMGEEYAEQAPFAYFIDHQNKELITAVREGRKKEFAHDNWAAEPADPKSEHTFHASRLQWHTRNHGHHARLLQWYTQLIALRKTHGALGNYDKSSIRINLPGHHAFTLHRTSKDGQQQLLAIFNLSARPVQYTPPAPYHGWQKILGSDGSGPYPPALHDVPMAIPGHSVAVYTMPCDM